MTRAYMPRTGGRNDWRTPPHVVELVREALGGQIDLDPCAPRSDAQGPWLARCNIVGASSEHLLPIRSLVDNHGEPVELIEADGLSWSWGHEQRIFVNPPFARNADWVRRCAGEALFSAEIILLIPARTDTRYWHDYIARTASAICFWRGRIRFVGAANGAPFPTAFVYWGQHPDRFARVFGPRGQVVTTFTSREEDALRECACSAIRA